MYKLIQLFNDDPFSQKIISTCSELGIPFKLSQVSAEELHSGAFPVKTDSVFLVNREILDTYYPQLLGASLTGFFVYVYTGDNDIDHCSGSDFLFDHYLPYDFSGLNMKCMFSTTRKAFGQPGQAMIQIPKKLIDSSLNQIMQLIDDVDMGIFWKDEKGTYIGCNKKFASDFGKYEARKIIGKTNSDLLNEKEAKKFSVHEPEILKTGGQFTGIEKEIIFNEGNRMRLLISKYPFHNVEGKIKGVFGFYKPVSKEKGQNIDFYSNENLLRILMDNIPDTIYFKDRESRFIMVNKAQAALIGLKTPEDAIGKTDFDFFNLEHSKEAFADEQRIIFDGKPINRLEYVGTKDGKFRWLNSTKVPFFDANGHVVGIVGITRDVDKMIRVEHKLKAERDLLQLLMDNIPSPIYFKDHDSRFTRVNKALVMLLGAKSQEEVLGKTDFDFYPEENARDYQSDEVKIIEKNLPLINKIEKNIPYSGEALRWFSTTKIPIKNEEGDLAGIIGVSHDVTEQILVKQNLELAKERAESASAAKSSFLSNMSHEIRTPMNGVVGMAEVLQMTELTDDQKKMVDLIIRSGNNLLNLINDILDFSKIENGKMVIENQPFDVKTTIKEVEEMMEFSAEEKGISFYSKIDTNMPERVIGDSFRFKQILINLVSNAIKFTREGEVVIEADFIGNSVDSHCIVFKVCDTGIGISEKEQENLFEAFTQADQSSTRKYGGTGLGLAICNRLVDMMGGKLQVESEKGRGSVFYFDLNFKKVLINHYD
ncbi:MAG: PAS domain-containing protein [Prolixibacteraceae bacterium]|nr:PAS domain-containing protein [Prolixibacteraceae bacterium]